MNTKRNRTMASYFGLKVEVLSTMTCCSLIRYQAREFIVDSADLEICRKAAAISTYHRLLLMILNLVF